MSAGLTPQQITAGIDDRMENLNWEEKGGQLSVLLYILATFSPPFSHQQMTVFHTRSNSFVRVIEVSIGISHLSEGPSHLIAVELSSHS